MRRLFQKLMVFVLTFLTGLLITVLGNAIAYHLAEMYLSEEWIDPVTYESSHSCHPLIVVLASNGEIFVGNHKVGHPGDFEGSRKNIARLVREHTDRTTSCLQVQTRPYCGPDFVCLVAMSDVNRADVAQVLSVLKKARIRFVRSIVRHTLRRESPRSLNVSVIQTTDFSP